MLPPPSPPSSCPPAPPTSIIPPGNSPPPLPERALSPHPCYPLSPLGTEVDVHNQKQWPSLAAHPTTFCLTHWWSMLGWPPLKACPTARCLRAHSLWPERLVVLGSGRWGNHGDGYPPLYLGWTWVAPPPPFGSFRLPSLPSVQPVYIHLSSHPSVSPPTSPHPPFRSDYCIKAL